MAEIIKPLSQNRIWASSGVRVNPPNLKYIQGWVVEQPPYQHFNYILNKIDVTLASINQHGMTTWDTETEYQANKSYTLKNGIIYYCKTTHTNQDPATDVSEVYWRPILTGQKPFLASSVNNYILPFLASANSTNALSAIGVTTIGRGVAQASTQAIGRSALGAGNFGSQLFTTNNDADARALLNIPVIPLANESVAGLAQRASDAEAATGMEDTKFLTSKKLKIGFSVSLGSNGYLKFPTWLSGLELRWGSLSVSAGGSPTVTTFPTTCLQAIASLGNSGTSDFAPPKAFVSGTSVTLYNSDSNSILLRWFAIGY